MTRAIHTILLRPVGGSRDTATWDRLPYSPDRDHTADVLSRWPTAYQSASPLRMSVPTPQGPEMVATVEVLLSR